MVADLARFQDAEEIVQKAHPDVLLQSCRHWHSPGVASIVVENRNGIVKRLVLVEPEHRLYVNMPAQQLLSWPIHDSLATQFVEHVVGHVVLYQFSLGNLEDRWPGIELNGGATIEERVPEDCREGEMARFKLRCSGAKDLRDAGPVRIAGDALRTWWCARGKVAAWWVQECAAVGHQVRWFNGCRRVEVPLYQPFSSASYVTDYVRQFRRTLAPIQRGES